MAAPASPVLFPDWASLPRDVLGLITEKLPDVSDRVRAASVCKSWFFILHDPDMKCLKPSDQTQIPMLLIPTDDNSVHHRSLYSVSCRSVLHNTRLRIPYNKRCSSSSFGWLIYASKDLSLTMLNPFSGATISLPPVGPIPTAEELGESFYSHDWEIPKVILSKDPSLSPDDYEALALFGFDTRRLALFRAGAKSWIYATRNRNNIDSQSYTFDDITYFKGRFFAVSCVGLVWLELGGAHIKLRSVLRRQSMSQHSYVVGCGDALMIIQRYYISSTGSDCYDDDGQPIIDGDKYVTHDSGSDDEGHDVHGHWDSSEDDTDDDSPDERYWDGYDHDRAVGYIEVDDHIYGYTSGYHRMTSRFKVYRLDVTDDGKIEVVQSKDLDGHAIFLGDNHACTVLASDFTGCRPDCIYYTDDWKEMPFQPLGPVDIGVYSFHDQCTSPLYVPRWSQWHLPPPIWIVPQANCIDTTSFGN